MSYVLVIPSYRRAKTCYEKTYSLLKRMNAIEPIIWVNDAIDYEEYSKYFPESMIRIGGSSLVEKRNLIVQNFPLGARIVMMDDDIKNLVVLDGVKKRNVINFNELVTYAFNICARENSSFWGVYPIDNPLCMNNFVRTNLCYCIGAFFGIINNRLEVSYNYAEDFERCLKYHELEGKVVRLDFVGINTAYYKESGGLQETRTEEKNTADKAAIVNMYPNSSKIITKRGKTEIKLISKRNVIWEIEIQKSL